MPSWHWDRCFNWRIGELPTGLFPLKRKSRTWKVNKRTGVEACRAGFSVLPNFGSTAHMIQAATLEAAFVDLQDSSNKASMTSLMTAYVCLSSVKRVQNICVMQPFSPFLFALGNPEGPERLIGMLKGEITDKQAIGEWAKEEDIDAEKESAYLMQRKHICVCCYLTGNEEYMLDARDSGVKVAGDFYEKYMSQGRWTRCLDCMRETSRNSSRLGARDGPTACLPLSVLRSFLGWAVSGRLRCEQRHLEERRIHARRPRFRCQGCRRLLREIHVARKMDEMPRLYARNQQKLLAPWRPGWPHGMPAAVRPAELLRLGGERPPALRAAASGGGLRHTQDLGTTLPRRVQFRPM